MTNTTDKQILTAAGKALLAQLNAEEKALVIDKMIFANLPNRPLFPQPDDVVPSNYIEHEKVVEQRGRLSVDSVIYSTTLESKDGPFEFNWTGTYCSEYGVLVTIDHHALTPKTADEPGVAGNTLVRSVVLEYKDIAAITNITVDASSWQYNANPRMKKMDSDTAQAIIDQNGKDWFIEDGFQVTPQSTAFNIKAGAGYVSGNRIMLEFDRTVLVPNKPSFIYVDAHREGTPTGEQVMLFDFVVTVEEKDDYVDAQGIKHFVCKIAQVLVDSSVSDFRPEGEVATGFKTHTSMLTGNNGILEGSIKQLLKKRFINEAFLKVNNNAGLDSLFSVGGKPVGNIESVNIGSLEIIVNGKTHALSMYDPSNAISFEAFGAISGGVVNNDEAVERMRKYLIGNKGGAIRIPNAEGGWGIEHTIWIPSNTTMYCEGEFVANGIMTPYENMMSPDIGAENVTIYGLKLNGNNQPAVSGFMPRRGCKSLKVLGYSGRNFKHDKVRKGGRGLSLDGGADGGGHKDVLISGVSIKDSYELFSIAADNEHVNVNIVITDMTAENCECLTNIFANTQADFPLEPSKISAIIGRITARNCGVSKTYIRNGALVNSQGGGNVIIGDVIVVNDNEYVGDKKPSILKGKMSNVTINRLMYFGDCDYVYDNSKWTEQDAQYQDDLVSEGIHAKEIKVYGTANEILYIGKASNGQPTLKDSTIEATVSKCITNKIISSLDLDLRGVYVNLTRTDTDTIIVGNLNKLLKDGINWNSFIGRVLNYASAVGDSASFNKLAILGNKYSADYLLESIDNVLKISGNNTAFFNISQSSIYPGRDDGETSVGISSNPYGAIYMQDTVTKDTVRLVISNGEVLVQKEP